MISCRKAALSFVDDWKLLRHEPMITDLTSVIEKAVLKERQRCIDMIAAQKVVSEWKPRLISAIKDQK